MLAIVVQNIPVIIPGMPGADAVYTVDVQFQRDLTTSNNMLQLHFVKV